MLPSRHRPVVSSGPSPAAILAGLFAFVFGLFAISCLVGFARNFPRTTRPPHALSRVQRPVPPRVLMFAEGQIGDPALGRRVDPVIRDCLNEFSPPVNNSHRLYLGRLGADLPSPSTEPTELVLTDVRGDPTACETSLRAAVAVDPPDAALDEVGRNYVLALRAITTALHDAYPYYRNHDWRDDGMARGRAMHPLLLQRYEAFARAHEALAGYVERAQRASPIMPCAGVDEGGSLRCDLARHQLPARQSTNSAARIAIGRDGTLVAVDLPRLAAETAELDAAVRRLAAIDRGHLPSTIEYPEFRHYVSLAEEHLRQIKDLYRTARDRRPVQVEAWTIDDLGPPGSPSRIAYQYNQVVEQLDVIR